MFLLLMFSGNPIFEWEWKYIFLAIILVLFYSKRIFDSSQEFYSWRTISLMVIVMFGVQFLAFQWNSIPAFGNLLAKILCAFAVTKILGEKFRSTAFIVMYWLCLIAVFFYIIYLTTGFALDWFGTDFYKSMGVWGHHAESYGNRLRNDGPFWEPGAFAGYIIMTIMLFIDNLPQLLRENKWKMIIIILALISTFSTTGYLVAFVIAGYSLLKTKSKKYLLVFIPIIIALAYYAYSLDFMGEKLQMQMMSAEEVDINGARVDHGRFTSMVFDKYYIEKHPIIGNGLHSRTRYSEHLYMGDNLVGFGNGFTGFLACMGIPFVLLFFYYVYKNNSFIGKTKWMMVFLLIALLFGEQYQNYPYIYIFLFVCCSTPDNIEIQPV